MKIGDGVKIAGIKFKIEAIDNQLIFVRRHDSTPQTGAFASFVAGWISFNAIDPNTNQSEV